MHRNRLLRWRVECGGSAVSSGVIHDGRYEKLHELQAISDLAMDQTKNQYELASATSFPRRRRLWRWRKIIWVSRRLRQTVTAWWEARFTKWVRWSAQGRRSFLSWMIRKRCSYFFYGKAVRKILCRPSLYSHLLGVS